jgi:lipid II:glycine glycyltransferase (peptidoglycan interpeptide bridge formation enzyme)
MGKEFILDPRLKVEVDSSTPAEWAQMLDLFNDASIYQTWSYGRVRWGEENLSHIVLKRDSDPLAVAQLRIVRPTKLKFGIAYLRWGPVCERRDRPLSAEVATAIAQALEEEYVRKRKLFLRVLPNAFNSSPRAAVIDSGFSRFTPEPLVTGTAYRTFVLDLAPDLVALRKRLDVKWRNQLTRSEKNNLKVIAGQGKAKFRTFCEIYYAMLRRKGFKTTVDVEEFGRMQEDLPERHRMYVLIAEDAGTPVAGLVASAMGDSAIYLLGATSDAGLHSKGAYLLHWKLIESLMADGVRWYDLGGIDPESNPGVYHFKKGFSGADVSQINPLVIHENAASFAMAKAGLAVQQALRGSSGPSRLARAIKQLATKN